MPRSRAPLACAGLALLAACGGPPAPGAVAPAATDSARFEQLVARYVAKPIVADDPERDATDAALERLDAAAERQAAARAGGWLRELAAIDTARLAESQRIDWLLLRAALRRTVADTVFQPARRVPGRYLTLGGLYWRVMGERPPTAADWRAALADLQRVPRALALGRRQLEAPPPLWSRLAAGSARSYVAFLRDELPPRVDDVAPDSLKPRLRQAAGEAAAALAGYAAWLDDSLPPGADASWAIGAPDYDRLLRDAHFLPFTAETMIEEGRRIHEATKRALDSLAAQVAPGRTWRQLVDEMQGRHPEPGAITDAYRRASRGILAALIRDDLIRIPPCEELDFVPTPPQLRETYAWGGYGGVVPRDGALVGRFFVTDVVPGMTPAQVREKLRAQNHGWITVIALHEGYPGHHLQTVYQKRGTRPLRQELANTYAQEGWALYAEHWMARAGVLADADARLAQLQMRLWRTARVIIDPSLHTGRMTHAEAVQFFVDEVGLERSAAEAEVNRFTTWPTQAPSYIVGWLELERLKADLRRALGAAFSEKGYVERVLEAGALPPALLRRAVLAAYGLDDSRVSR